MNLIALESGKEPLGFGALKTPTPTSLRPAIRFLDLTNCNKLGKPRLNDYTQCISKPGRAGRTAGARDGGLAWGTYNLDRER